MDSENQKHQQADSGAISYSSSGNVYLPAKNKSIGIYLVDWERLEEMVSKCKSPINRLSNVGWSLIGIAGSALTALITTIFTTPFGDKDTIASIILFAVFLITVIGGLICLLLHRTEEDAFTTSIENIKIEMKRLKASTRLERDGAEGE